MKKYFKKFSVIFVVLLAITGVGITQHGSVANAGTQEVQWQEIDDSNNGIYLESGKDEERSPSAWNSTYLADNCTEDDPIIINAYTSNFRLISGTDSAYRSNNIVMEIDGDKYRFNEGIGNNQYQVKVAEKLNMDKKVHQIKIYNDTETTIASHYNRCILEIDAIEIDKDGYLLSPAISLDKSTMDLTEGNSETLTATTTPAAVGVRWSSSDISVATVDSTGRVIGVSTGTCTITATTADGLTATCTVTVSNEDESIYLNKSTADLTTGDSEQLTATTTPAAVGVSWTSSDSSVATVDSTGKVTAIGAGTATITATTTDGSNLSAYCIVNVIANNGGNNGGTTTGASAIVNIAYAKGDNTNNAGGDVSIIFNGAPDTTLSVVKTASVKSVWVGDTFTYTIVVTNTGSKTAKAVVINDSAPNHIQFMPNGITTTQGTVDPSSSASNIVVNVGDIHPSGTVTITVPATVVL